MSRPPARFPMGAMGGVDYMAKQLSIKERIRQSAPVTKPVTVWLGADMGLVEEYEEIEAELKNLRPNDSLAGDGGGPLRDRLAELRQELDQFAVVFRLRGLDDGHYESLLSQHPPRRKDDGVDPRDLRFGWNIATFPAALVRASTVEPELDDEDWRLLIGQEGVPGKLTAGQLDELAGVAFRLSKHPVDVPFSSAASPSRPSSAKE
jgi:hypothetical protein